MKTHAKGMFCAFLISIFIFCFNMSGHSQDISIYQYRHVPNENIYEFIRRETTYWSKVAQKAIDDGKLEFWGFFQKMGGVDLPNSSNFLFIVTPKDLEKMNEIWDHSGLFPELTIDQIETFSMSTVTTQIYTKASGWQQIENANPENDFRYMTLVYHTASDPGGLIDVENEIWAPFIKSVMDKGQISQKAWGNAVILSPSGPEVKFNTVSYDIYPSLKEALDTRFDETIATPDMTKIGELETGQRASIVYRIVSVVSAN